MWLHTGSLTHSVWGEFQSKIARYACVKFAHMPNGEHTTFIVFTPATVTLERWKMRNQNPKLWMQWCGLVLLDSMFDYHEVCSAGAASTNKKICDSERWKRREKRFKWKEKKLHTSSPLKHNEWEQNGKKSVNRKLASHTTQHTKTRSKRAHTSNT